MTCVVMTFKKREKFRVFNQQELKKKFEKKTVLKLVIDDTYLVSERVKKGDAFSCINISCI